MSFKVIAEFFFLIFIFVEFILFEGNSSDSEEDQNASSIENQAIPNSHRVSDSKAHQHHTKIDIIRKEQAKNTQRYKVEYDSQSTDTLNFSSESKQETEYVSIFITQKDTSIVLHPLLPPLPFHSTFDEMNRNPYDGDCCSLLRSSGSLTNK